MEKPILSIDLPKEGEYPDGRKYVDATDFQRWMKEITCTVNTLSRKRVEKKKNQNKK